MPSFADVTLHAPDGTLRPLTELGDKPILLQVLRYYGWLPCLELLTQLRERQPELDQFDVRLLGVATREAYQAQKLIEDGFGVDLFLDPDDQIRRVLGSAERLEWWRLLHPVGAKAYVMAARQAKRFDPIWAEATQRPGLLLIDQNLDLRWSRMGTRIGDYPSADEVIKEVGSALSS